MKAFLFIFIFFLQAQKLLYPFSQKIIDTDFSFTALTMLSFSWSQTAQEHISLLNGYTLTTGGIGTGKWF